MAGSCEHSDEAVGYHKVLGISWMSEQLLTSQEGLFSVE
jgi:hypothetical protein